MGNEYTLEVKHLTKKFGNLVAVDDVSFSLGNEFFSILGPSGSGKTTTLRIISGLESPDRGQVFLNAKDVTFVPPEKRDVHTVFQSYALFPHMTVFENVAFGLRRKRKPDSEIRRLVKEYLEMVNLSDKADKYPRQLSGGEKQRVALIRALINHPQVLLLDEPLGALDLKIRQRLQLEMVNIRERVGITFVYVTHDQGEALTMSDRIAVMHQGKILQIGEPKDLYEKPCCKFVAYFIGNTNFFEGVVIEKDRHMAKVRVPGLGEFWGIVMGKEVRTGENVNLSVRPEKVHISRARPARHRVNAVPGVIEDIVYVGVSTEFDVILQNGTHIRVFAQNSGPESEIWNLTWEDKVWVYWRHDRCLVLRD
jgi:spermidine/putrescine transport system ATP-binding protein